MDTPRSQRPVQQEWYEDMNKSRLTHVRSIFFHTKKCFLVFLMQRTEDASRATNRPYRHSIDSIHHPNTPKDLPTFVSYFSEIGRNQKSCNF